MNLANRMNRLGTETAFEVLAKAKKLEAEGKEIVHLEIGEPDFDTPKNIKKAAIEAIKNGYTHYTPSAGIPKAREAVSEYLNKTRPGINARPEDVVITVGGKPVMLYTILALVDEGDEVICPNPTYPIYESLVNFVGGKTVPIQIKEEKGFNFDVEDLEKLITPKTKLIVINSPANPTGGVIPEKDMEKIVKILEKHPQIYILSDEIYSEIIYSGKHISIATYPGMRQRTIVLDGLSKTYAMTGWRLGYGLCPSDLAPYITKLITNSVSCAPAFGQMALIESLTGPQNSVKKMLREFKKRRDAIVKGLNEIPGFSCQTPKGAFYVFPNITKTGYKSQELADMILYEAGVACLSGTCFGAYGEGYLRFSYANSLENINKAIEKIKSISNKWADKVK
ncbi:MAG: pyridoxal phosphate-dependent aminotransferase [Elusimicrobiales bacterium]|nr:pyridoxal phosphate-dependent aminotransferase [Elusimicrobiales bacterium]HOJ86810.1 pyridoxal phosphate-dependent aminotransferase [Elusimicrobiales bacterium]HOL62182.1 pyridoxal phosphate-dependent aminotransferase [Elusimicrobiales bacterium]HPO94673.1 pyridoxal phosphate-dependent aminotransferase [Elusimicrobiales bacterium]